MSLASAGSLAVVPVHSTRWWAANKLQPTDTAAEL